MATPFKGIILDTVTNDYIEFVSFDPLSWSRNVSYSPVQVRGRSEPHIFYSYTDEKIWKVSITLTSSIDQGDDGSPQDVRDKEAFLESLILPDYGSTPGQYSQIVKPPHLARISILRMIDAVGAIYSLSISHEGPYEGDTGYPYMSKAVFDFHVQRTYGESPLGYADVRVSTSNSQGA